MTALSFNNQENGNIKRWKSFFFLWSCVHEKESSGACFCLHCALLVINLAPDYIKHHTPTTLHNCYNDIIEYRQQSMTEQALRETHRQRADGAHSLKERKKERKKCVRTSREAGRQRDRETECNTEMAALCWVGLRGVLVELMMHTALCSPNHKYLLSTHSTTHMWNCQLTLLTKGLLHFITTWIRFMGSCNFAHYFHW